MDDYYRRNGYHTPTGNNPVTKYPPKVKYPYPKTGYPKAPLSGKGGYHPPYIPSFIAKELGYKKNYDKYQNIKGKKLAKILFGLLKYAYGKCIEIEVVKATDGSNYDLRSSGDDGNPGNQSRKMGKWIGEKVWELKNAYSNNDYEMVAKTIAKIAGGIEYMVVITIGTAIPKELLPYYFKPFDNAKNI